MSRTGSSAVPVPIPIGYFGKIPSRADFVKASENPALSSMLDAWLAQAIDLLSADARWKLTYDALAPMQFAFIGPRRGRAIAGHLVASTDQSGRRFPFLLMSTMAVPEPADFVPNSPLLLAPLWQKLAGLSGGVLAADDPADALHGAAASAIELDLSAAACAADFDDFLARQSVASLDAMLAGPGFTGSVRQALLALGLLLQPVMASSSSRLEKSLVLPLPAQPGDAYLVAAFWMHLITPFLMRADFELSLFLTHQEGRPALVLGFSGASAQTLQAIMDPQVGREHHIGFDDLDWVEDQVDADYAIKKVSTYLAQGTLSLKSAGDSLRAAFLGS